jgi:hypothetical protein
MAQIGDIFFVHTRFDQTCFENMTIIISQRGKPARACVFVCVCVCKCGWPGMDAEEPRKEVRIE